MAPDVWMFLTQWKAVAASLAVRRLAPHNMSALDCHDEVIISHTMVTCYLCTRPPAA